MDAVKDAGDSAEQESLASVLESCWTRLAEGARDPSAAFHTPVLGTQGTAGCELRAVVLREFEPGLRVLVCHADVRSPKVAQLHVNARAQWLFYDLGMRLQIRATGPTTLHTDDALADRLWDAASLRTRLTYRVLDAPGTVLPRSSTGLPAHPQGGSPTEDEVAPGRENLAVLRTVIESLDWLRLGDTGNVRARFLWNRDAVEMDWLSP